MSRVGQLPIQIPGGVSVNVDDSEVLVKGPKGELHEHFLGNAVSVKVDGPVVRVARRGEAREHRAAHGLTRTLIANMVEGVSKGYRKSLELQGVGYRVTKSGDRLNLTLGFSHPVAYTPPKGITLSLEGQNRIHIEGVDKQAVGQVAAEIRALRPPEPYKGKGIRYEGEVVRKKLGKAAKAGKK
jgi:large subunit ribosomal protein L6